jgi:quercetin dioxygenase-like cupin family protein
MMIRYRAAMLAALSVTMVAAALAADSTGQPVNGPKPTYAYATNGVVDNVTDSLGDKWKLLIDKSNLGGNELEAVELTMPAGAQTRSHHHKSIELIYVLSGVYGHEVNGKLYLLKPGMVGIVRPEDSVRHLVPKAGPAKLLIIWIPSGEAKNIFRSGKGVPVEAVAEASALDP